MAVTDDSGMYFTAFHYANGSVMALDMGAAPRLGRPTDIWGTSMADFYVASTFGGVHFVDLVPVFWGPMGVGVSPGRIHGSADGRLALAPGSDVRVVGDSPAGPATLSTPLGARDVWMGPTTVFVATVAGVYRYQGNRWLNAIPAPDFGQVFSASSFGRSVYFLQGRSLFRQFGTAPLRDYPLGFFAEALVAVGEDEAYVGSTSIHHLEGDVLIDEGAIISGDGYAIADMAVSAEGTVYAVGTGAAADPRTILRKVGGAWSKWTIAEADTNANFTAVAAPSDSDIWVGADTQVLHFDGVDWTSHEVGALVRSIYATEGAAFVAAGATVSTFVEGVLDHTAVVASDGNVVSFVWGASARDVFAGAAGVVFHYDGSVWARFLKNRPTFCMTGSRAKVFFGEDYALRPLQRRTEWSCATDEYDCADEADNDCDGFIDSDDPDCSN